MLGQKRTSNYGNIKSLNRHTRRTSQVMANTARTGAARITINVKNAAPQVAVAKYIAAAKMPRRLSAPEMAGSRSIDVARAFLL